MFKQPETTELPKYVILTEWETHKERLTQNINNHVDQGYKIHTFNTNQTQGEHRGIGEIRYNVLLSLSSAKYEGITNLKDIDPTETDTHLNQGWTILETFSKKIRITLRA